MHLRISHAQHMNTVGICSPLCNCTRVRVRSHLFPRRKVRQHKGQTNCRWSFTAIIQQISHDIEHAFPSGRRDQSNLYMRLKRIRGMRWIYCAVPTSDDDPRVFGGYGWRQFWLINQTSSLKCPCAALRQYITGWTLLVISQLRVLVWASSPVRCYRTFVHYFRTDVALFVGFECVPCLAYHTIWKLQRYVVAQANNDAVYEIGHYCLPRKS